MKQIIILITAVLISQIGSSQEIIEKDCNQMSRARYDIAKDILKELKLIFCSDNKQVHNDQPGLHLRHSIIISLASPVIFFQPGCQIPQTTSQIASAGRKMHTTTSQIVSMTRQMASTGLQMHSTGLQMHSTAHQIIKTTRQIVSLRYQMAFAGIQMS